MGHVGAVKSPTFTLVEPYEIGDIRAFPFLTPPDSRGVKAALDLLTELGAVTLGRSGAEPRLTKTGREIARMPIDPRFARMLLEAQREDEVAADWSTSQR